MLQHTQARLARAVTSVMSRARRVLGAAPSLATHTKASRTGPLIAFESLRQPVWTPRDYTALASEGFAQNAIVYRSVRMVAEAAASVPLLLYRGDEEITAHPLLRLPPAHFWLMTPRELAAALNGLLGVGHVNGPPPRSALAGMMVRYPD